MIAAVCRIRWPLHAALTFLLFGSLMVGLQFVDQDAVAAGQKASCKKNSKLTTEQYAQLLKNDPRNYTSPTFKQVPADVNVVKERVRYKIRNFTIDSELPIDPGPVDFQIGQFYRFTSLCRVQGPAGDWWLVPAGEKYLSYIPAKDVEKAADYDARLKKELEERQKSVHPN